MKIMYVAPRYHTNQAPIVKGWIDGGDEVCFLSQYAGNLEDYSYITPVIVGYSHVFQLIEKMARIFIKNESKVGELRFKCGIPPVGKLRKKIKEFQPDIVILRERSVYSIGCYFICKKYQYPSVLYNQSPLWEKEVKNDFAHKLIKRMTPPVRITPVLGNEKLNHEKEKRVYYVPFVMEAKSSWETRGYFADGRINIFTIGKYEKRKNHQMMIEVIEELGAKYPLYLRIAGECTTQLQKEYYQGLQKYIKAKKLGDKVKLLENLSRQQVDAVYAVSDLFIIPSTLEPASISQLEAMAFSLPVICSDTNGTACYVENGRNGYRFKDNNKEDLKKKTEAIISDKERLLAMGKESYHDIIDKYNFQKYRDSIEGIRRVLVKGI